MNRIEKLRHMRDTGGVRQTSGLSESTIERLMTSHADLGEAIDQAFAEHGRLCGQLPDIMALDEAAQIKAIQAGYVNFYQEDAINPYVALAARGPWIVTSKGAVVHDTGGYGMLGFGHAPEHVLAAMSRPHVMANIMTPSVSQLRLDRALRAEIGHRRGHCPFDRFLCLNSGSEAVGLASRISDVHAKLMTDAGGKHAGRAIKIVSFKGAFHGRTDRPAQFSDSTRKTYREHLATFRGLENLLTVAPNDVAALRALFADAQANNWHIEAVFLEPVMGEGNPGQAMTPEFYAAARELTRTHDALLLVDSIQAGLRAHGCLSIVDYPGFESLEAPDMETYSKALNAGQYPLSVLALNARTTALYRKGIYGNTMTTNPRAMDVACAVLESITPELRANIVERGREYIAKLEKLSAELPGLITKVQGTGLLCSCELAPQFKCYGAGSTEEYMRFHGYGVIHGGTNSLRFTPTFLTRSDEVDLVIDGIRDALVNGPRKAEPAQAAAA